MISSCGFFPDLVTLIPSEDAVDGGSALPCLYIVLLLGYFITVFFSHHGKTYIPGDLLY